MSLGICHRYAGKLQTRSIYSLHSATFHAQLVQLNMILPILWAALSYMTENSLSQTPLYFFRALSASTRPVDAVFEGPDLRPRFTYTTMSE